jgi:pSer/pThr/pTyr-binding forkhead associated (FHA) protein
VDLHSTNGTTLNGRELVADVAQEWQPGDTVQIGPFSLVWEPAPRPSEVAVPAPVFTPITTPEPAITPPTRAVPPPPRDSSASN